MSNRETDKQAVIQIQGIRKSFAEQTVHDGIDLTVNQGEILTLMGGSGSGKSVLLRSLIGLEKPDEGHIYFKGRDIVGLSEDDLVEVRKRIAYVFQYGALFDSLTVKENLAYPLRAHTKLSEEEIQNRVVDSLKKVGLEHSLDLLPSDLSGGMQRRVGVVRSIIMEPEIILYDEPTTGLDPYNTKQILNIIMQLKKQGKTAVLVTHDMHAIFSVADRVAFLKDGKIRALGTTKEISETKDPIIQGFIQGESW
ncbi:ATP-binding cassette domain-containing protein [bacterium]|nr:ATP-binding cassette domain-containing protein [bacterium]